MTSPNLFQVLLILLNAGGCLTFLVGKNYPWTLVYFGATCIAVGSLWAAR